METKRKKHKEAKQEGEERKTRQKTRVGEQRRGGRKGKTLKLRPHCMYVCVYV